MDIFNLGFSVLPDFSAICTYSRLNWSKANVYGT